MAVMEEKGERALRLVLALNLVATLVKIGFGLIIGSMALLVDGLDSTLN
ncbi:MAG: cation transporter, partial [Thermoprotei archaeon]